MDLRGYFGFLGSRRVLGRWNDTEYLTLRLVVECAPTRAAFFAVFALASFDGGFATIADISHHVSIYNKQ
jgi:hypothetical protein